NLAHGIYPPLLRDAGLAAALRAVAARSPLAITVVDERPERAAEPVEVAVYFCCLEALQNVAKHAPDAHVTIGLATVDGALFFTVADDGPGFDSARSAAPCGSGPRRARAPRSAAGCRSATRTRWPPRRGWAER